MCRRVLAATEESSKAKQSDLEKLELDIRKLHQELDQLNRNKLSLHRDIEAVQQQLQGKRRGGEATVFLLRESCLIVCFLITEIDHAGGHGVSFRSEKNVLILGMVMVEQL